MYRVAMRYLPIDAAKFNQRAFKCDGTIVFSILLDYLKKNNNS